MCEKSRRSFMARGAAFLSVAAEAGRREAAARTAAPATGTVDVVASDVYFHKGIRRLDEDAACNNGWIVFEDSLRLRRAEL